MIAIQSILCPVDFSPFSDHALQRAAAVGRWYESTLTALHVFPNKPMADVLPAIGTHSLASVSLRDVGEPRLREELHRRAARFARGVDVTCIVSEAPDVDREILAQAGVTGADLIVMGTHGRSGFQRVLLGSVAEKVLRRAHCPVMVVPAHDGELPIEPGPPFKRILCPVDFSDSSLRSLEYVFSLAEEADAHLTLLHIVDVPPELTALPLVAPTIDDVRAAAAEEQLPRLRRLVPESVRTYCRVDEAIAIGHTSSEILMAAESHKADLIVMGVMGRGALDMTLFGSTTHAVLRGATCPVLTVRAH